MSVEDYITYIFQWHNLSDSCEKCRFLGGKNWTEQDLFQNTLYDSIWGDIWNLDINLSLAHPYCRCQLEVRVIFDWNKLRELNLINDVLRHASETTNQPSITPVQVEPVQEISFMSEQINAVRESIRNLKAEISDMSMGYHQLREFETLLSRTLRTLERSTGSPELKEAINAIQRVIMTIRILQFSLMALQAHTGPVGWLLGMSGLAMAGTTIAQQFGSTQA